MRDKDDYLQQLIDEKTLVGVYVDDDIIYNSGQQQTTEYHLYEGVIFSYSIIGVSLILANAMKIWLPMNRLARILEIDNSTAAVHEVE